MIYRRARELRLPPDWKAVGFYTSRKAGKLILGVRALGVWCVVLDCCFGDDEDCFRIEIIFNFSKDRARVRDAMTPARQDEHCRNVLSRKLMATDAGSLPLSIKGLDSIDRSAVAQSPPGTMKELGGARVCEGDKLQETSQKRRRGNRDMQEAVYQDVDVCGAETSGLQERAEQRGSCGVARATPHENEMTSKNIADIRKMCVQSEGQLDDVDDRVGVDESLDEEEHVDELEFQPPHSGVLSESHELCGRVPQIEYAGLRHGIG